MNFNWDDMKYVLTMARTGTLSDAAKMLNVNYTTVARRIKHLEKEMGVPLFHNTNNKYIPTANVQSILSNLEAAEAHFHTISRQVFDKQETIEGDLCVTFPALIASPLIFPHIKEFQKQYPNINLTFIASSSLSNLDTRQADIALRISKKPPENLIGKRIGKILNSLYSSKCYLKDNTNQDIQLLSLQGVNEEQIKTLLKHDKRFSPGLKIKGFTALQAAIESSVGVGILPDFIGDNISTLEKIDIYIPPTGLDLWILSHPDYKNSVRVKAFKEFYSRKLNKHPSFLN